MENLTLLKKNLVHQEVNKVSNSIGSNIFIRFGKDIEYILRSGKKYIRKEWTIAISNSAWRITRNGKYVAGSADDPKVMQYGIESLLGKRFLSVEFISDFLDASFEFEGGFRLTTFFDWEEDYQWVIFLPNQNSLKLDCSIGIPMMQVGFDQGKGSQFQESTECVSSFLHQLKIKELYQNAEIVPWEEKYIKRIFTSDGTLTFVCENGWAFGTDYSPWRIEKEGKYYAGWADISIENEEQVAENIQKLVGQKIKQIETVNSMMDTKLIIGEQYVLKTFACYRMKKQWNIYSSPTTTAFSSNIPLEDIEAIN